jgi:hypothetical protein
VKWASLVLLAAAGYALYPYYVAYSLKQAVREEQAGVLDKRVDFAAVAKTLSVQLARRLKIEDQSNRTPCPVVKTLAEEKFLQKLAQEYFRDKDGFLKLFQPLESKKATESESAEAARLRADGSEPISPRLVVRRAGYASLGHMFFSSLREFSVTLKSVTLDCEALVPEYSTEKPVQLQAAISRVRLTLRLDNQTWQLNGVEIMDDVNCQIVAPWIEADELAGTWQVEGKPELDFEVMIEPGGGVARLYRAEPGGSLSAIMFQPGRHSASEIRFQSSIGRRASQATVTKDRQGKYLFALDDGQPAGLTRAEVSLSPGDLNGVWKPLGGGIAELELGGNTFNNLGGTATDAQSPGERGGNLKNPRMFGQSLDFDLEWDDSAGLATLSLYKRHDGKLHLALKTGRDADEARYFRLDKIRDLPPPLTAKDLAGRWETDRLHLLDFQPTGPNGLEGSFVVPMATNQFTGRISQVLFQWNRTSWQWTYPVGSSAKVPVSGTGGVERWTNGQFRLKMLAQDSDAQFPALQATTPPTRSLGAAKGPGSVPFDRRYRLPGSTTRSPQPYTTQPPQSYRTLPAVDFADGLWYDLRPFGSSLHILTVFCDGVRSATDCQIHLVPPDKEGRSAVTSSQKLSYTNGTQVTLTAPELADSTFVGWFLDGPSKTWEKNPTLVISLDQDKTLHAKYLTPEPKPTPPPQFPKSPWVGTWETDRFGEITIRQQANALRRTFYHTSQGDGWIDPSSSASDRVLKGRWLEGNDYQGELEFTLSSNDDSFKGRCRFEGTSDWSAISGKRKSQ